MELEDVFSDWGVDIDTLKLFQEHKVTVPILKTLSDEDLKELVPLMGPRNLIKAGLKRMQGFANNSTSNIESRGIVTLCEEQEEMLNEIVADWAPEDSCNISEVQMLAPSTSVKTVAPTTSVQTVTPATAVQTVAPTTAVQAAQGTSCTSKQYDLEAVLKASGKGQIALVTFKNKKGLNDSARALLAECIVCNEVQGNIEKRITAERAKYLAQKVVELFPTEVLTTWYRTVPRPNGDGKTIKGRIITRFYTQRRLLIKAGLLDNCRQDEEEEEDVFMNLAEDDPENCQESLAWLKGKNVSPWTRVLSAWTATSRYRMLQLHRGVNEESGSTKQKRNQRKMKAPEAKVTSYSIEFPQIRQPQGWTLLELDFELYQKQAVLKLAVEFPKLEKFVCHKLAGISDELLDDDMNDDTRCARVFLSLSKLFPVITLANKKGKGQWRPSRQEVRDSFLLHIKAVADLKETLRTRQDKLGKYGLTNQPIAVIVGQTLEAIEHCYVVVDDIQYVLETPLKAIDVVFKAYHALHATYPPESEPIWMFLQRAMYKFRTKWDREFERVDLLEAEYVQFNNT